MSVITNARAYANNEIALIAWDLAGPIDGCMGFEVTRIDSATRAETVLPSWVAFEGQHNPQWKPQPTTVWPVQKLYWEDLTVRKDPVSMERLPDGVKVRYRVRPMVAAGPDHPAVTNLPPQTYEGTPVPLAYLDEGIETNDVVVTADLGKVHATFTNGILSTQWLSRAYGQDGEAPSAATVKEHIAQEGDPLRQYLSGDVVETLKELIGRAANDPAALVYMALYELSDPELMDLLANNAGQICLILSNSSGEGHPPVWDTENQPCRDRFQNLPFKAFVSRMFNNERIGHNKFAVLVNANGPAAVMTGSTNWTSTGLCAQSNNALIVESPELARQYLDYWNALNDDTKNFAAPAGVGASTGNVQGSGLRSFNITPRDTVSLDDGTQVKAWFAPDTMDDTTQPETPPDLGEVFSMMQQARDVILFAVFLPSVGGKSSVIEAALNAGGSNPSLLVCGTVSDLNAMPSGTPPAQDASSGGKTRPSAVYDQGNVHVVGAQALSSTRKDLIGDFEAELLSAGFAIIHDKIVVVDPLSDDGFVVTGSHNLGFKASYENDENLLIISKNPALVQAYAVHLLDLYEHYRFRAIMADRGDGSTDGGGGFDGFLSTDSQWLQSALSQDVSVSRYFSRPASSPG